MKNRRVQAAAAAATEAQNHQYATTSKLNNKY